MRKILYIVLVVFIAGCLPWVKAENPFSMDAQNFAVDLPEGWMRQNNRDYLLLTRDGVLLQNIFIERFPIESQLKYTKKKLRKGMLPQEAAEIIIDNLTSNQDLMNVQVIENVPAKIVGRQGFKAVFTFKTKDDLRIKSICYGFMDRDYFYSIRFTAASRFYFERDVKAFEKVLKSFRLLKA